MAKKENIAEIIRQLGEMFAANELEGLALVAVDSGYEIRTMFSFNSDTTTEVVAGLRFLENDVMKSIDRVRSRSKRTLADIPPAGHG